MDFRLSLLLFLACATASFGHPVAYMGATQVTATKMPNMSTVEAYHTYKAGKAFGLDMEIFQTPKEDQYLTAMQHNWLLKRWNLNNAQGNLYAGLGGGVAWGDLTATQPYGRCALQADFETLWIYTAVKSSLDAANDFSHVTSTVSLGFAPYAHEHDGIATWLIVDFTYVTEMDNELRIIPKIRLFRNTWFVEAGVSLDGEPLLSCMIHF